MKDWEPGTNTLRHSQIGGVSSDYYNPVSDEDCSCICSLLPSDNQSDVGVPRHD